jgi:hypothetical protein
MDAGPSDRIVGALVIVNLLLQVVDGAATWIGIQLGFTEGNPLIASAIGRWGTTSALVFFKLEACACLLAVWYLRRSRLAGPALVFSATTYLACSVAPWSLALSGYLLSYIAS